MPKIMEIIEKETKGKSYHTYKYSYDSIMLLDIPQMSLPPSKPTFFRNGRKLLRCIQ